MTGYQKVSFSVSSMILLLACATLAAEARSQCDFVSGAARSQCIKEEAREQSAANRASVQSLNEAGNRAAANRASVQSLNEAGNRAAANRSSVESLNEAGNRAAANRAGVTAARPALDAQIDANRAAAQAARAQRRAAYGQQP
jgi:hypothetical protein